MSYALVMRMHGAGFAATIMLAAWLGLFGPQVRYSAGEKQLPGYGISFEETGWIDRYGHWVSNSSGRTAASVSGGQEDREKIPPITAGISVIEPETARGFSSEKEDRDGWVKRDSRWIWMTVGEDRLTTSSIFRNEPFSKYSANLPSAVAPHRALPRREKFNTRWVKINGSWILQHTSTVVSTVRSVPLYVRPMSSPRAVAHHEELARQALSTLLKVKRRPARRVELPVSGCWEKIDGVWVWLSNKADPIITGSIGKNEPLLRRPINSHRTEAIEQERSAVVEGYWRKVDGEWQWNTHRTAPRQNASRPVVDVRPRWVLNWRLLGAKGYA